MKSVSPKINILFVHGAWHGKWCWDKHFRKTFEEADYDVHTFDLPGHDKFGKIQGINKYRLRDYTNALIEEVHKLDTSPIIIAHSMGGLVLQKYLETHTCQKAVFLASVPPYGVINTTLKFARKPYFYPSLFTLDLYGLVNSTAKSSSAFFSQEMPKEEVTEYKDQLCSESFSAFLDMLLPKVKLNEYSKIPILVVGAKNDTIFSEQDNIRTANKFDAELLMIDDIAHDMMLDVNHHKVSAAILEWLEIESR